ncbi:tripartite tricarboxylate transporter permease [Ovoidimarina sediminis]|uniref:tripartite tricarboxylate transporter permease n=1 Tax=Ovoidimarina sediminis TaxID=3079856 RepID=UPI00290C2C83|nr:tripartite tricarboxylate transporter permease [Rhodophyticola sp. MJ-SS7]MDU8942091.1 tripartite tricarboxylate transporter permease [Rhodophyticola sp. MJ-SS7]
MFDFLIAAVSPLNLMLALLGVAAGTIIGSIPGLTATMAVAVLVPLTFTMSPDSALILMGAIYTGAIYGGAYAAILLNTPGTPSAIATTFDGYPMAKRGDGDLAVSIACLASVIGGLVGALALLLLAPPLAEAALAFGPVEYFWLAVFGLSLISALSSGDFFKGVIGACFGLLIAMIGISETSAEVRFTFGSNTLLGGVETVSALIGLYCIPVLIDLVATPDRHLKMPEGKRGFRLFEAVGVVLKNKINVIRSSVIGTMVGALPGAGGSIAGLVAYSEARRSGKGDEKYGEGNPGGIIATESANNATVGGGFIPTLVLGIPGTPPDAVILGALLVQGVRTGPSLFADGASIVYTFIFGLLLATILMLPVGLLIGRFAYRAIVQAPKAALVPVVAFMTVIGAFAIRNSISDIAIMIVLGVIGWIAGKRGFSASPIVLGLILGRIAEQGFVQSWTIGDAIGNLWGQFFGRPLSLAIIALTVLTFLYPFWPRIIALFTKRTSEEHGERPALASGKAVVRDLLGFAAFAVIGTIAMRHTATLNPEAAVFPRTIAMAMLVFVALAVVRLFLTRRVTEERVAGSPLRMVSVPLLMLGAVLALPVLGFEIVAALLGVTLIFPAQHDRFTGRGWVILVGGVIVVTLGVTLLFSEGLGVPLP